MAALMAGDVQFAFLTASATAPLIASGKLKALGVTSLSRVASMPTVPTVAESGLPGFDVPGWFALVGPANMQESVVARVRDALSRALAHSVSQGRTRHQLGDVHQPAKSLADRAEAFQ